MSFWSSLSVGMTEKAGMHSPHAADSSTSWLPEGMGAAFCMGSLERWGVHKPGLEGKSPTTIPSVGLLGSLWTQSSGEPLCDPLARLRQPRSEGCWWAVGGIPPLVSTLLSSQACLHYTAWRRKRPTSEFLTSEAPGERGKRVGGAPGRDRTES